MRPGSRTRNMQRSRSASSVSSWLNFTPLSLSPALWLDASDTATITESSGAVSQWDDKSGNGRHMKQATAANQPTTGSTTANGLNTISFDGSADRMLADNFDLGLSSKQVTYFAVFKSDSLTGNQGVLSLKRSAQYDYYVAMFCRNTGAIKFEGGDGGSGGFSFNSLNGVEFSNSNSSTYVAVVVRASTSAFRMRLRGIEQTLTDTTGDMSIADFLSGLGATQLKPIIGARLQSQDNTTWSSHFPGKMAEIGIIPRELTDPESVALETYLVQKWGISP